MTTPGSIIGVLAEVRSTFAEGDRAAERALRDDLRRHPNLAARLAGMTEGHGDG